MSGRVCCGLYKWRGRSAENGSDGQDIVHRWKTFPGIRSSREKNGSQTSQWYLYRGDIKTVIDILIKKHFWQMRVTCHLQGENGHARNRLVYFEPDRFHDEIESGPEPACFYSDVTEYKINGQFSVPARVTGRFFSMYR